MAPGFRMAIGNDLGEVAGVSERFGRFADAHGVPAGVRRSVQVALDDLLSNSIMHGYAGRPGGEVAIQAELSADRIRITITDDGEPFDPLAAASPDTSLTAEQRLPGGLGIHLVRQLMDEVSYERKGGRNIVTVAKRLTTGGR